MGVVNTTNTFTATDTITSTKMNDIIDQTTFTDDAVFDTTLAVASGKLKVKAQGITSNELADNAVITAKIADSNVTTAKIADSNVTTAKIADSNITTVKIADSNVTQPKLGANVAGNGPAFRAYASTVTNIQRTVFTKITLDAENFDTNSNFNVSRFTPTTAGYYQINATLSIITTSAVVGFFAIISKNGSSYAYGSGYGTIGNPARRSTVSDIVYLNGSTDYIELFGYFVDRDSPSSSGINTEADSLATFMSGCLIRSA